MPSKPPFERAKLLLGANLLKFQQIREDALNVTYTSPHGAKALQVLRAHNVLPALACA